MTITVTNVELHPDLTPKPFGRVKVGIVGVGWQGDGTLITGVVKGNADINGLVSFPLAPSPAGTWYVWNHSDRISQSVFTVPSSGGPYTLQALLVTAPQAAADPATTQAAVLALAGAAAGAAQKANNLSDLASASTARSNLGVLSTTQNDARYPNWVCFTDARYADPDAGIAWNNCVTALGSGGGTIYVPAGTYTGSTVPTLASKIVVRGAGENASFITFTGGGFVWSTDISKLRFEHINLKSTNGDLFAPTSTGGMHQSTFKHCLLQNLDGHSIWNQNNAVSFQEMTFADCELSSGSTGTTPAFNVVNSGGAANGNRFLRLRANGTNNTHRPFFWIESSSTGNYAYDNRFEDIIGEQNPGGLVWLLSNFNSEVNNVQDYDATTSYVADVVRIGKSAVSGGLAAKWCLVKKSGRRGGTLSAGVYDVNIGPSNSAVQCIAIQNNYSTGAVTTLYNSDTIVIGEGVRGGLTASGGVTLGSGMQKRSGTGSPNSVVTGSPGDEWTDTAGAADTIQYLKTSGSATNTGWTVKPIPKKQPPIGRVPGGRILLSGLPRAMTLANITMAKDTWLFMPVSTPEDIPLTFFGVVPAVLASGGTAALTFALYNVDAYNRVGTLVTDFTSFGTTDLTTGSLGVEKTFTLTGGLTIPAGDWYIGAAWTGTATTPPQLSGHPGTHPQIMSNTSSSGSRTAYQQAVSGASAPSPSVPAGAATAGLAVWGVHA